MAATFTGLRNNPQGDSSRSRTDRSPRAHLDSTAKVGMRGRNGDLERGVPGARTDKAVGPEAGAPVGTRPVISRHCFLTLQVQPFRVSEVYGKKERRWEADAIERGKIRRHPWPGRGPDGTASGARVMAT